MRLLLLISALFAALSGVVGTRLAAQPVGQSVVVAIAAPRAVAVAPSSLRFLAPRYGIMIPLRLVAPASVSAIAARLLYAQRRRE